MVMLYERSYDMEEYSILEINNKYDKYKKQVMSEIKGELLKIPMNISEFYDYVYGIEAYHTNDNIYIFTYIEYEGEVYLEYYQFENFDEVRDIIDESIAVDPDGVLFEMALFVNRN